jgi:hypothetical protein
MMKSEINNSCKRAGKTEFLAAREAAGLWTSNKSLIGLSQKFFDEEWEALANSALMKLRFLVRVLDALMELQKTYLKNLH